MLLAGGPLVAPEARLESRLGGNAAATPVSGQSSAPAQTPAASRGTVAAPSAAAASSGGTGPAVGVGADEGVGTPGGADQGAGILLTGGVAPRGRPEFEQRQRLLAACGWNTRIMDFAVGGAAGGPSAASPARAEGGGGGTGGGSSGGTAEVSSRQAVIYCTMCGAKHGLWTFLGGSPAVQSRQLSGSLASPMGGAAAAAAAQTLPCTPTATSSQPEAGSAGPRTAPGGMQGRHATRASPAGGPASAPAKGAGHLLSGLCRGTIAGGSAAGGAATPASGPFGSKSSAGAFRALGF